jgi:hypothetical protein
MHSKENKIYEINFIFFFKPGGRGKTPACPMPRLVL